MSTRVQITLESKTVLVLSEAEVRALDGIFGYSVESFLKVFYEKMGKIYVEPYEAGVRSLHETIRKTTHPAMLQIDAAREKLRGLA